MQHAILERNPNQQFLAETICAGLDHLGLSPMPFVAVDFIDDFDGPVRVITIITPVCHALDPTEMPLFEVHADGRIDVTAISQEIMTPAQLEWLSGLLTLMSTEAGVGYELALAR